MKIEHDPFRDLQHARDCLALESFSLAGATSSLKELLPSIMNAFASNKVAAALPPMTALSKDQSKFLKLIGGFPYTDLMVLRAYLPEGVSVNYLEYLALLLPTTHYLKDIQKNVTSPYLLFLAQIVSDKQAALSTRSQEAEYNALEKNRDALYAGFAKLYTANSFAATTSVKHVVDRNADWKTVFEQATQCAENMQAINLSAVQSQLKQCSDYLDVIHSGLATGQRTAASTETAQRLSAGAYQVARELELLSSTYYRVLALNGSIENTLKHITESVG